MSKLLELYKACDGIVCTDSRDIEPGCLFFCLKGDNFNAHDFIDEIIEKGAGHIVVDDERFSTTEKCFKVDDVLESLQQLAIEYRKEFTIPVVVIGGSNGKTTTKELTKVVLETKYTVHATKTNHNNHIGVPLTVLSMPKETEIAVIEIGANHKGEHKTLLNIAKPTHVLVTNNGKDHLEGFGSLEGVREANYEIYAYAEKHNATVFLPDFELDLFERAKELTVITFGNDIESECMFKSNSNLYAGITYGNTEIKSQLFGDFNEKNIMSAFTIGLIFDCETPDMVEAVKNYEPELLRSQIKEINGTRYMIDCYNANPTSMSEALKNFKKYAGRPAAVVLGDMLEMGKYAEAEHAETLKEVKEYGFDLNVFVGENFGKFELEYEGDARFHFFENSSEAKKFLTLMNLYGFDILLKGSKGTKIRDIVGL
ncbi:MAG: UDP-N-acetylmuramoyl-tripeptide--D-alanyl-D-alanine ligase [Patescibacteria group bacterium]